MPPPALLAVIFDRTRSPALGALRLVAFRPLDINLDETIYGIKVDVSD